MGFCRKLIKTFQQSVIFPQLFANKLAYIFFTSPFRFNNFVFSCKGRW